MMRDPETVELFVDESLEAVQRIERLLLAAEQGESPPDLMASLFRDIHTIKGTSGFLEYERIRSLAHVAEDLLSRLRDGSLAVRVEHYGCLLETNQQLGQMVASARDTGEEGEVDVAPLVARLHAFLDGGEGAPPSVAAPPVPTVAPTVPTVAPTVAPTAPPPRLGEILLEQQSITPQQLEDALATQAQRLSATRAESGDTTVRVPVAVLDRLLNQIGELVLARNQVVQFVKNTPDNQSGLQACQRLSLVTSGLQEQVMKTRMQPVGRVFDKIPGMLRQLCQQTGKRARADVQGSATDIDKTLVEALRDPIMHIVRNAVDHGLESPDERRAAGKSEQGQLSVRAAHEGGRVVIEIEDDGRGMDPQKLRAHAVRKGVVSADAAARLTDREAVDLVFRPGFSTAAQVSDISGRGVGMDVVRTHVERAGGQVELDSVAGRGTVVRIKMPLTLAILPTLLVSSGDQLFAIPQVNLLELVYLDGEQAEHAVEEVGGSEIHRLRGEMLPLVRLDRVLGLKPAAAGSDLCIAVITVGTRRYGLVVDAIRDTEEIVIKPLYGQLKRIPCFSGATVLGDGRIALILEMGGLAALAGVDLTRPAEAVECATAVARATLQRCVVFRVGGAQCAVPLAMVARLERVPRERIERVAEREVVQFRGRIMPIVRPERVLSLGPAADHPQQALVVVDFGHPAAVAVDEIVDIAEIDLGDDGPSDSVPFAVGHAVVVGRATLVLDVYRLVREVAPDAVRERHQNERRPRLLIADDSHAMRTVLAGYLRARGLEVVDAPSGEAALAELRAAPADAFDAVVTDLQMLDLDGFAVIEAVRRERPTVPVFVWTSQEIGLVQARALAAGAVACIDKLRREDLIAALEAHGIGHTAGMREKAA